MASIVSSKRNEKGVIIELQMSNDEAQILNGYMDNIHVIAEEVVKVPSRVSLRGKNEATKYFLIPKLLRKNLLVENQVMCQKIETDNKVVFVYLIDKFIKREWNKKTLFIIIFFQWI